MFRHISIPPFFTLIKRGKVLILLKDSYKDLLLKQGIDDIQNFLKKNSQLSVYHEGRTSHPSIPLGEDKRIVLRQYSHGGVLRAFTGNLYLLGARSFKELAITEEIRSCGISTIVPIGAVHEVTIFPLFYRAYLLTLEVPEALNAIQYLEKIRTHPNRETIRQKRKKIGHFALVLRQFHQSGFFHRDLQMKNILVTEDRTLIIDFDRSYRKRILSTRERLKNLLRLDRSVEKWRRSGLSITRTDRWRFFLAYAGEDKVIRKAMERALHIYSLRSLFYRFGWAVEEVVRS